MQQPLTAGAPLTVAAPSFYLTRRQPLGPGAILLGAAVAMLALSSVVYALGRPGHVVAGRPGASAPGRAAGASGAPAAADDNSDFDTIVLGDAADAPSPARPGDHVSDVHPFAIVHLPRFGEETGLIPATPAGHLLYDWLAAFNQSSLPALGSALPTAELAQSSIAQLQLREQTGGFALLSAREIKPGLLVFRLRDQTTQTEALGTLQLRPNSRPAAIQSFSLRSVPRPAPRAVPASHA